MQYKSIFLLLLHILIIILIIFEIEPGGVGLPPLLWYFLYITCSDIALILSIYTYLKCFDLTFSEEKYPIKAKLLGFAVANLSL